MDEDMKRHIGAARFAADLDDDEGSANAAMLLTAWGSVRVAERVALILEAKAWFDAMSRACRIGALLLSDVLED